MAITEYLILILASGIFRFDAEFRSYTKKVGLELSVTKSGSGYQDAITPRELNFVFISSIVVLLGLIFMGFAFQSVGTGFLCIGVSIGSMVVTGLIIAPFGKETILKSFILRYLFASMNRRYRKYKKQNDNLRAEAMNDLIQKFKKIYL
jgi:hypothetical protein